MNIIKYTLVFLAICQFSFAEPPKNPEVILFTNFGEIKIELYPEEAPKTVKNFLAYVEEGFYNGTIFHRVIKGFMAQGGGFTEEFVEKPTKAPIKNEAHNRLKNSKGTVAMARTSAVDSATAQFFINTTKNDFLNFTDYSTNGYGYCVFGKVISGMDVVKKIEKVKTGTKNGSPDVPVSNVVIERAEVVK